MNAAGAACGGGYDCLFGSPAMGLSMAHGQAVFAVSGTEPDRHGGGLPGAFEWGAAAVGLAVSDGQPRTSS